MSVLLTVGIAAVGIVLLAWMFQRRLIYFPSGDVPAPSQVGLTHVEEVQFPTADGLTLNGWFIKSTASVPASTVVVFNGNAGHRAYRAPLAIALQEHGVQVLLFDYRGYGDNEGTPTEAGLRADARAVRSYVVGRGDVDAARLVYFGESLGSAVAVALAAEHPPAGLVLRSPFTSLVDVGQLHYPFLPVQLLLRDRFAAIDDIRRVDCPVLVIAGDRDRVVPLPESRRLYDAMPSPKELVILAGDHNDIELLAGDDMIAAIVRFLRQVL